MNLMGLFRSPQNELEKGGRRPRTRASAAAVPAAEYSCL